MKRSDPENGIVLRRGIYWFSHYVHGERQWENLETTDLYEAIQRKAEILRQPRLQNDQEPIQRTFDRYLAWKLANREHRPISGVGAKTGFSSFLKFLPPDATARTVHADDAKRWYSSLVKNYMLSTAEQYASSVQGFFRWVAEEARIRNDNPMKAIKIIEPTQKAIVRFADRATRDKLIKVASGDLKFVLFAGFHAGLRKNEISEARVFWFDLKQGIMHVQKTPLPRGIEMGHKPVKDVYGMTVRPFLPKGKKDRTIPLTDKFKAFLKTYLRGRDPSEFVCAPSIEMSGGLYRWWPVRPFSNLMEENRCKWISPHIMRHTFASLLVMRGVSLFKVAVWLGDSLQTAENHYAHLAPVDADIRHLD